MGTCTVPNNLVHSVAPFLEEFRALVITTSISGLVSLGTCLLTRPESDKVLRQFYRFARPPGAWHSIKHICFPHDVISAINRENSTDLMCTGLIVVAQLALYVLAVSVVSQAWMQSLLLAAILIVTLPLIYFKWYVKLKDRPVGLNTEDVNASLLA